MGPRHLEVLISQRPAEADDRALAKTITQLPEQLRRSLTWDRGKELSAHAQFTVQTGLPVYFADPNPPWQRGTNENTNGLAAPVLPERRRPVPLER